MISSQQRHIYIIIAPIDHNFDLVPFLGISIKGFSNGYSAWLDLNDITSLIMQGASELDSGDEDESSTAFSSALPAPPSAVETTWTESLCLVGDDLSTTS